MAVAMGCVDNSPNPCSAADGGGRNCLSDLLRQMSDSGVGRFLLSLGLSWNPLEWFF